jgi:dolichol-phosphate mannosyltransferase
LVVPTYNEADNLAAMLESAHAALAGIDHEVIVVDDDSPDRTWEKVEAYAKAHPWASVIRRIGERGLSSAVMRGFAQAQGRILGVMDADRSHDERILPELIAALGEGADLAVGSRRVPGGGATRWPWYRRLTSDIATRLAKGLLGVPLADPMSGYFVMKREIYESCKDQLNPTGYKILLEIVARSRPLRMKEIPYVFKDRRQGYSKFTPRVIAQYVAMLRRLRPSR